MDRYDVAVIGGGPAGLMAAKHASICGASTVVLEEHRAVGYPVQCAGLLGIRALEASEIREEGFLLNPFRGAVFVPPDGSRLSFRSPDIRAWAVDRRLFDRSMAVEAVRHGVEIMLGAHVRSLRRSGDLTVLELGDKEIAARAVISAEGVRASIARRSGIPPPKRLLSGAQVEVPFDVDDIESVEVHLGRDIAPGLFAWVIPISRSSARVGLCATDGACSHLRRFLSSDRINDRIRGSPVSLVVGGLPLGPPDRTVADGMLAVGDAAAQVKPTSGGGVYPGLVCGRIAGRVAAEHVLNGGQLERYEREWRSAIGREISLGMKVNDTLRRMSDGDIDMMIRKIASRPEVIRAIEKHGDIDRPSRVILRVLTMLALDLSFIRTILRVMF
ncbi:MAG TPA: NAD(P)/FAD-dependent oxidoreductase [Methanothrix sp.]|mgnify:CR=1 FL=1|nr:NAD(P)/FAD-dependent oxidoreductase [Methanothrix sp.]HOK58083.1 NAD(P)/FAD-dependent oxidoreductase [Methanothrix sp.]HOL42987.1 NAD(P)/FAD-dependent oxidoreductase [Methanothrix sp.]HPO87990.1 NAD(P)/FAD-dependent oxidoreductase [Methanothrix sp.]